MEGPAQGTVAACCRMEPRHWTVGAREADDRQLRRRARLLPPAELGDGLQVVVPAQAKAAQLLPHLLRLQARLHMSPCSCHSTASQGTLQAWHHDTHRLCGV